MHKIFRYPKFSETFKGCPRKFSALWGQDISTEKVIPPSMHKIFWYPKFSETLKGCPRIFSALWDQDISTEKRDTPLFIHKTFWNQNFLTNCRIPLRKFSALWDIKISTENRDNPPLIHKFFSISEIFWNTEWFHGEVFSVLWDKIFVKASPRILSKHRSVLLRNFSVLWYKDFSTEFSDIPFLCIKFCDARNFDTPKCSPTKFFGTVRQKILNEKSCIEYRNQWWNWCL